jgi:hypothetical protein
MLIFFLWVNDVTKFWNETKFLLLIDEIDGKCSIIGPLRGGDIDDFHRF